MSSKYILAGRGRSRFVVGASLAAIAFAAVPSAHAADGGNGGDSYEHYALGGVITATDGGNGVTSETLESNTYDASGGAGGSSGIIAGNGGNGGDGTAGTGGTGGLGGSFPGQDGEDGQSVIIDHGSPGAGGGGAGAAGMVNLASDPETYLVFIEENLSGGDGGNGGSTGPYEGMEHADGGAGGGGAGGTGLITDGDIYILSGVTIAGGAGGNGGDSSEGYPGEGGDGGDGVLLLDGSLVNEGTISAGAGGTGGTMYDGSVAIDGANGVGVRALGDDAVVSNYGTISGVVLATDIDGNDIYDTAVQFEGANATFVVGDNSVVNGDVVALDTSTDTNTVVYKTALTTTIDTAALTEQFVNFGAVELGSGGSYVISGNDNGVHTWTAQSANVAITSTNVFASTLVLADGSVLDLEAETYLYLTDLVMGTDTSVNLGANSSLAGFITGEGDVSFNVDEGYSALWDATFYGSSSTTFHKTGDGTLMIDEDTVQADSGAAIYLDGGSLWLQGDALSGRTITAADQTSILLYPATDGPGSMTSNLVLGGELTFVASNPTILNGDISGDGSLRTIGDDILLRGDNTYTGGTVIESGMLTIEDATKLGTGAVTVETNGTLQLVDGFTFANDIVGAGGTIQTYYSESPVTLSGDISGSLLKLQGNDFALTGDSIDLNTLNVGRHLILADQTINADYLLFDYYDPEGVANGLVTTGDVVINGYSTGVGSNTTFDVTGTLILNTSLGALNSDYVLLEKTGTGSLVLNGYDLGNGSVSALGRVSLDILEGNLTINGDVAAADANLDLGIPESIISIYDNASLTLGDGVEVDRTIWTDDAVTLIQAEGSALISGDVEGVGFTKTGAGALNLSGTGSLEAVTVSEGTLGLASSTAVGDATITVTDGAIEFFDGIDIANDIAIAGSAEFIQNLGETTLSGDLSGEGSLVKTGNGKLILTGTNSFTGGITIDGGLFVAADGSSLGSGALNLTDTTFELVDGILVENNIVIGGEVDFFQDGGSSTLGGDISGEGQFIKTGLGTVLLTGTNTYTGGTLVSEGTISGDLDALQGEIEIGTDGTLVIDQDTDGTFGGSLLGDGMLIKDGLGMVTLAGSYDFAGSTSIVDGGLNILGDFASDITIQAGGTLTGDGSVGGIVVADGGVLAPNGTMTANGSVTFQEGSTFQVRTSAIGENDALVVNGGVSIEGGLVNVIASNGAFVQQTGLVTTAAVEDYGYGAQTSYTLITADNVDGTFDDVQTDLAFLTPSLVYTAGTVGLVLQRNDIAFSEVAVTPNEMAVGQVVDAVVLDQTGLYDAIVGLSADETRAAFNSLSGEAHASVANVVWQDVSRNRRIVSARLDQQPHEGPALWVSLETGKDAWDGNANSARYEREVTNTVGGIEYGFGQSTVGLAVGYSTGHMDIDDRGSNAKVAGTHVEAYAGTRLGSLLLALGGDYADFDVDMDRDIQVGQFAETASSSYGAKAYGVHAEVTLGTGALQPFAGINWTRFDRDAFSETGATLGLDGASQKSDWTYSALGLKGLVSLDRTDAVSLRYSAQWQHALDGTETEATMAFNGTTDAFTIAGTPLSKDAALVDLGFDLRFTESLGLNVSYAGTFSKAGDSNAARATLSYRF